MRIIILQDYLRNGGTERQSIFLANYFKGRGHDVTLVTFRPGGVLFPEVQKFGLNHVSLQSFDTGINFIAPGVVRRIKQMEADVIMCMGRMANNKAGRLQRKLPNALVVSTIRTGKVLPMGNLKSIGAARMIVVNSHWWKDELEKIKIGEGKVHVVYNSLTRHWDLTKRDDTRTSIRKKYSANDDTCVFLNVSGFRPGKQQDVMIRLFSKIKNQNSQLWLVGEGEQHQYCKSVADKSGVGDRIKFVGYQANPFEYFAGADVALSTSVEDAQPNFLVEAQTLGLPVIAYDYRGVKECFDPGKSGILIDSGAEELFKQAMDKMAEDASFRMDMEVPSKEYAVRSFHPEANAEKYLELFSQELDNQLIA